MRNLLSFFCIFIGICFFIVLGYFIWQRYVPQNLAFSTTVTPQTKINQKLQPIGIRITSLHINLPVVPVKISGNVWPTTTSGVSYVSNSPVPGELGNSIFYGHDFPNLLGSLPSVKPGQEIQILYNNYATMTFLVKYTSLVPPTQTDILAPSKDRRITLYTCAGFFDTKRFVAVAIMETNSNK